MIDERDIDEKGVERKWMRDTNSEIEKEKKREKSKEEEKDWRRERGDEKSERRYQFLRRS